MCGPIGILSGSATIKQFKAQASYARFGTSIASAGDLNDDNYKGNSNVHCKTIIFGGNLILAILTVKTKSAKI